VSRERPSTRAAGDGVRVGTQEGLRRHNLGTLLGHLHLHGALSRADLTHRMGLNRSTIAALVAELATLGAVQEETPAGSRTGAGRPSLLVRPRPDRVQVVAVEIGVDHLDVALVGLGGQVMARRHDRLGTASPTPQVLVEQLCAAVHAVLADGGLDRHVVGLGVALPGVVRQGDGCVRFAPNLRWTDVPLGSLLSAAMPGTAVRIGNDGDLGALAEHRRGAARGVDDVVFVAGETGIGGGFIVGGRPLTGAGGYAGEVGHMTVRAGGRLCHCGSYGCWETEIGAGAIAAALGAPSPRSDELVPLLRSAGARGDGALDEVARYVGIGLGNLVNLLNPALVILGGLLREVYPLADSCVRAGLRSTALRAPAAEVRISLPALGGDAVLIGAAEMVWDGLLDDPATMLRPPTPLPSP